MFTEFENIFKKKAEKIINIVQDTDLLTNLGNETTSNENDYSKTPQKFNINGREIQEKKLLAEGAFGFVWLAEDTNTKEEFALKRVICMTEDKVNSALIEKSVLETVPSSPFIIKYYGGITFKKDGNTVIVTLLELCPGGNLFDLLEKREGKGIPEEMIKNIAISVLQALIVMHKANYTHRDIKIENVLIGKDKRMKICDFGSCTKEVIDFAQVPKSEYEHIKETIESFTTPMYRSPEMVDPYLKYKVSSKSDLWMLGCTLYTMAYFVHPFVESNAVGIAGAVFKFPKYPEETKYNISPKIQDLIRNFLTPNPDFRPSAEKMLEILTKWDDLAEIPLNQEAKKLKKEHEAKQEEMKKLNQKVSKYDGDIPLDELMKLSEKLKGTNIEHYEKPKISFINNKETQKTVQIKQTTNNFNIFNNQSSMPTEVKSNKTSYASTNESQSKKQDSWNDIFANPSQTKKVNQNLPKSSNQNFDAFNDVFTNAATGKEVYKSSGSGLSTSNISNFHEFFEEIPTSQSKSSEGQKQKSSSKVEMNLLDL